MRKIAQIEYLDIENENNYEELIEKVIKQCFYEEKLLDTNIYISITLTNPENIRKLNKEYRNIDKETDVLSFPMFEKSEIEDIILSKNYEVEDVLGDIIISVERVKEQAKEFGHSFERELAYMLVHGFYHLMGYDHIEEKDKLEMRPKEEKILQDLNITRI
jgi:probable rRNA maturation factor